MLRFTLPPVLLLIPALAGAAKEPPIPVEVERFEADSRRRALDVLAQDLTDSVRRGLNASGRFVVVRSDLAKRINRKQKRLFSAVYAEEGGPELGRFTKAKVLVRGRFRRMKRKKGVKVRVSFTDMTTLESLPHLDFVFEVLEQEVDALGAELASLVAEKAATAGGTTLDDAALEQVAIATTISKDRAATAKYAEGRRLLAKGDFLSLLGAEKAFEAALALDPELVPALVDLVELQPRIASAEYIHGRDAKEAAARTAKALRYANRLLEIGTGYHLTYRAVAGLFLHLRKHESFVKALTKAKELNPSDPKLVFLEALSKHSARERIALVERSLELDPFDTEARIEASTRRLELGELDRAKKHMAFVLRRIDPNHVNALIMLAYFEYLDGEFTRARKLLQKAVKRDPTNAQAWLNLSFAMAATRRSGEKALARAIEINPAFAFSIATSEWDQGTELRLKLALHRRWPRHTFLQMEYAFSLIGSPKRRDREAGVAVLRRGLSKVSGRMTELSFRMMLAKGYESLGDHQGVIDVLEPLRSRSFSSAVAEQIEVTYARNQTYTSKKSAARATLGRLTESGVSPEIRAGAAQILAYSYRREGEDELALSFLRKAARTFPGSYVFPFEIAEIFRTRCDRLVNLINTLEDPEEIQRARDLVRSHAKQALTGYETAIALDGGDAYVHARHAEMLSAYDRDEDAHEAYAKAARIDPKYNLDLAQALYRQGRRGEARRIFANAIADHPSDASVIFLRGRFLEWTGDEAGARTAYADAYHMEQRWGYLTALIRLLKSAKRHDEAVEQLKVAMAAESGDESQYWTEIALVESARGDMQAALSAHLEAKHAAPTSHPVLEANVGWVYARLGRHEEAARAYQRAIDINPRYANGWVGKAEALVEMKREDVAAETLLTGLKERPLSREIAVKLAEVHRRRGDCAEVIALTTIYEVLDAGEPAYASHAGHCHLRQGRPTEAVAAFVRALKVDPERPALYEALGRAHLVAGELGSAAGAYAVAAILEPKRAKAYEMVLEDLLAGGATPRLPEVVPPSVVRAVRTAVEGEKPVRRREKKRRGSKRQRTVI